MGTIITSKSIRRNTEDIKKLSFEIASGFAEPVDRVVQILGPDRSKEVILWVVIGGQDNGLFNRPSLCPVICVMWLGPLKYNTIQYNDFLSPGFC